MKNGTFSYGTTPVNVITKAIADEMGGKPYPMELVGSDRPMMTAIINQGIDAHLEAFTESQFTDNGNRLYCQVGPKDMLVLLRRLEENGSDEAMSLRTGILSTLEIEEI